MSIFRSAAVQELQALGGVGEQGRRGNRVGMPQFRRCRRLAGVATLNAHPPTTNVNIYYTATKISRVPH